MIECWSRDDEDVGVGRTKMTALNVVVDELAFLRQVRWGLVPQRLEYLQDGQLVLDSASHWQVGNQ